MIVMVLFNNRGGAILPLGGTDSVGVELDNEYFKLAERSIPRLAALYPDFVGQELQMNGEYGSVEREDEQQLAMVLAEKTAAYRTKPPSQIRRNGSGR
jgi:hypothetical protein